MSDTQQDKEHIEMLEAIATFLTRWDEIEPILRASSDRYERRRKLAQFLDVDETLAVRLLDLHIYQLFEKDLIVENLEELRRDLNR